MRVGTSQRLPVWCTRVQELMLPGGRQRPCASFDADFARASSGDTPLGRPLVRSTRLLEGSLFENNPTQALSSAWEFPARSTHGGPVT